MTNNPRHPSAAFGYTTSLEVKRLRAGGTAVVQSEPSDFCTVAVRLGEDDAIGSGVKALEWNEPGIATALGMTYDVWLTRDAAQGYREIWLAALLCHERERVGNFASKEEARAACQADFERRVLSCLSTHTAAGAGPVGEAVAGEERLADTIRSRGWAVAVHNDYRLNGEAHTFWLFTKDGHAVKGEGRTDAEALGHVVAAIHAIEFPAARPVEVPGEVERLTRERDEARRFSARLNELHGREMRHAATAEAALAETRAALKAHHNWHLAQEEGPGGVGGAEAYADSPLCSQTVAALAESEQKAKGLASDLAGTQAALAEMRERLEKVEAAARPVVEGAISSAADEIDIPDSARGTISVTMGEVRALRTALSTQESSAPEASR